MSTKTFENEYGDKITVEVKGNVIWVKHDDINEKRRFRLQPILRLDPDKFTVGNQAGSELSGGIVVLKSRVILSSREYDEILRVAIELGYEDRRSTDEKDTDR